MAVTSRSQFWFAVFAVYFAAQVAVRTLTGGALGLDEAQILRHAQNLSWGYGPQPPLYAWLQYFVLQATGNTIFGLSLLKNAFLLTSVCIWFLLFRREVGVARAGFLVAAFALIPQFSWESQRALTHSVLAGTLTSLFYFWFWSSLKKERRTLPFYGVLGLLIGFGILSKATFLIVPIATTIAALSIPSLRSRISGVGLALSAAFAGVITLPHGIWNYLHRDLALSAAWKFEVAQETTVIDALVAGSSGLAVALISFSILAIVVLAVLWVFFRAPYSGEHSEFMTWLQRSMICAVVVIAIVVLASGTTNVKDRWLQAALMPLGAVLVWHFLSRATETGRYALGWVLSVFAFIVLAAQPYHSLAGRAYRAAPFAELAPQIAAQVGTETKIIGRDWIVGNLIFEDRSFTAHVRADSLNESEAYALILSGNWSAEREKAVLDRYREQGLAIGPIQEYSATYRVAIEEEFSLKVIPLIAN